MHLRHTVISLFALSLARVPADEPLYRYEGDVMIDNPSSGWVVFNACDGACVPDTQSG